jgi:hypothetical protein
MKILIVICLISLQSVTAQSFDGIGLGLAGNYTASSRGVNSMAWNPANLAMYRPNNFELNFVSVNAALFNSGFSVNDYNKYFTLSGHNGEWSIKDRQEILNKFSGDGLGLNMDINTNILSFVAGNFGLGIQLLTNGSAHIDAGKPLEIILFGETIERDYEFSDSGILNADFYSALKNSISYSYLFKIDRYKYYVSHLAVGISLNYYMGLAVAQSLKSSVDMRRIDSGGLDSQEEMIRYETRILARTDDPSNGIAGKGFGMDLGVTARFARSWYFSLSVSNLFASINWSGNPQMAEYSRVDSIYIFANTGHDTSYTFENKTRGKEFKTSLPVVLRAGLSLRLMQNLTLSADLHQGLNGAFGNSKTPRIGIGAEFKPIPLIPLRSGIAIGGRDKFLLGVGSGLHFGFLQFDFSYAMSQALQPMDSNGIYTSFSLKLLL